MNHFNTSNVNLIDTVTVVGAYGTQARRQPNRRVSLIVGSVKNGAVDVFFGSMAIRGSTPHLHFGQQGKPEPCPIPCGQYEFVFVASDPNNPTEACFLLGGPGE
jgi:hypothetical protein